MSTSRRSKSKKASKDAAKLYDDFPTSVGLIHPDVRASYPDLFSDFAKHSKSKAKPGGSRKASQKTSNSQPTQRVIRSSSKFRELASPESDTEDYFDSLDWYYSNKRNHERKLQDTLSDFRYSDSSDTGNGKQFYTYVLMDSRVSKKKSWSGFSDSVFYVGKGKNGRAYSHTKAAEKVLKEGGKTDKKTDRILDIWEDGGEVIVLKVADNLVKEEALTREALMIEAKGKERLCNMKNSTLYGSASVMKAPVKRELGANLFVKAREEYIKDGGIRVSPPKEYFNYI